MFPTSKTIIMRIRNSVKAIIVRDGRLLCNKNMDERGVVYCVPGGGQDFQEVIQDTVRRECIEEIGAKVDVGDLLFVREYIGKNHSQPEKYGHFHQVEFFFECKLFPEEVPILGEHADANQVGVEWLPFEQLKQVQFFPKDLIDWIARLQHPQRPVYLGDVD